MTQHPTPLIHPNADPFLTGPMPDPTGFEWRWAPIATRAEVRAGRHAAAPAAGDVLADPRFVDSPCGPLLAPGQTLPEGGRRERSA